MLHLIGIGAKKEDINFEMKEAISKCERVFLEYYTSFYDDSFEELSKFLGKEIEICDRVDIESKVEEKILEPSKKSDIALLILGDPLIATTHTDLILRTKEMGVKIKVYPNISIANQITKTGLQFYKFGKITSIPFFNDKFMPRTPYIVFMDNYKMGAHSLFLLDLNPSNDVANKGHDKYLSVSKALEFLIQIPKLMVDEEEIEEKEGSFIDYETDVVVCSRLGFKDEIIKFGTFEEIIELDKKEPFSEPVCIIIPGDLHDIENEFLSQFKING